MKSRLLARNELDALSDAGSPGALIAGLAKTAYRRSLDAALVHRMGREAALLALRSDLEATLGGIRGFYRGHAAAKVGIVLRAYDVHNLKAVLRGLSSRAAPDEIGSALIPVGELSGDLLIELAQATNPRVAVDLLATMALPFAAPLIRLRAERPGATTVEMEFRLDDWYFRQSFEAVNEGGEDSLLLALRLEADVTNLQTVLRLAAEPELAEALGNRLGIDEVGGLLVGPGRIPFSLLESAGSQQTVAEAVELLAETAYSASLDAGLDGYRRSGRLGAISGQLQRHRLKTLAGLIIRDPLGIGVVLGYLALKTNEVNNLRWIANGIHLGMEPKEIRAGIVYPP